MKRRLTINLNTNDRGAIAAALRDIAECVEHNQDFDPDKASDDWADIYGQYTIEFQIIDANAE